ncbi:MAG: hypothetical protein KC609_08025 [Myxococcales bacterium]|nr:hypothetical protein [Myxococcales bacterium]
MRRAAQALLLLVSTILCFLLLPRVDRRPAIRQGYALPLYTARSGRTCDNCHTNPTGWENPSLPWRKCTLSCQACHLNPSGGGLRTTPGRFYAQATLPMLFASHRGYKDWNRHLVGSMKNLELKRRNRLVDPAFWHPLGGPSKMAFLQSRYAGLNADPLLFFGVDSRLAWWYSGRNHAVFPMQFDLHAGLRMVRHLVVAATGGLIAQLKDADRSHWKRISAGLKDVYVMVDQLPMMTYIRAGRFLPPFGTNIDDHTSPIRRDFELDGSRLDSRVTGVEIGMAPNYPYVQFAVFRPNPGDLIPKSIQPPFLGVKGWGIAASAGWRDLAWQLGVSFMMKRRNIADGGDIEAYSVQWGFNPWYFSNKFPLTYMGEFAAERYRREGSVTSAWRFAVFNELDYLLFNGVNLSVKHDYSDADLKVADDHANRLTFGVDLHVLPSFTIKTQARLNFLPHVGVQPDFFMYLRGFW